MTDASRPTLRDEQKALTRRRLLDSAEAVFARSGFRGASVEEQARGAADHWIEILRERPDYFPLLIEFWAYTIREPAPRERLAGRLLFNALAFEKLAEDPSVVDPQRAISSQKPATGREAAKNG